ncbi:MAG: SCO family protein [Chloroflexota bacterium]
MKWARFIAFQNYLQRWPGGLVLILTMLLLAPANPARADKPLPQNLIKEVGFDQKLSQQVPPELEFTDSLGQPVKLGDYFGEKPVILALGYYRCPMLCSLVRNGLYESLKQLDFTVGQEFEVVIVSIDPAETPQDADIKRQVSIMNYERPGSDAGWHFLVGQAEPIRQLAQAVGFRYTYDEDLAQYVHPAGIVILTPQGQISRYLYGIDFPARDLRLGLVEAAANKIGSAVDQLLLLCYHYDPVAGEYTLFIMNIIRLVGLATVLMLGGTVLILLRRDRTKNLSPGSA